MPQIEYAELTIPLGVRITPSQTRGHAGQWHPSAAIEADPIITEYVNRALRDGWAPAGPTNLVALAIANRVKFHATYGVVTAEWKYTDYISVTIQLQRSVP